jgi:signal transduction histidine kinase
MGFSSLIADYYDNKPKLERFVEIINSRCNDLLEIINGILDISKIESGQMTIRKEPCDLKELFYDLHQFFEEHQIRIGKQHISLNIKVASKPAQNTIITDKVKLRQILINLISNALKYTNEGKIEAGYKIDENNRHIFYVSDTGIGIPAEMHNKVFQRFVRLHDNDSLSYSGTGLGLAIVKGLTDLLEGKIWFESESNRGTTFYFSIPAN